MKKLNLVALLLGAALFLGFGVTNASAGMKCGAGKCGSSMKVQASKSCGKKDCECGDNCKCGDTCKCGEKKSAGKCGKGKKTPQKAMKCGTGKCGSKK